MPRTRLLETGADAAPFNLDGAMLSAVRPSSTKCAGTLASRGCGGQFGHGGGRLNAEAALACQPEEAAFLRIMADRRQAIGVGGGGADIIYGGLGADALDGSGGADSFQYRAVGESTAASRDTLAFGSGDRIDLSLIDADTASTGTNEAFALIGSAVLSNVAGQLRAAQSGGQWIVEGGVNGD